MPIAAKLSKKFYDRFGEDVANELVDLLNVVAATYKSELRELNDASWARFDARLEQRVAELRSELKTEIHTLAADMKTLRAEVRGDLKDLRADLLKWMFLYWTATAAAGLLFKALG